MGAHREILAQTGAVNGGPPYKLYKLNLGGGHKQTVDTIQIPGIEEVDFDLAFAALRLKDFDLRAQHSSKFGFSGADVRIDYLSGRSFSRLLLRCLMNQKLCGSD